MAGLIGYEMKKLFSRRIVPFLLLALFVFNGLMVIPNLAALLILCPVLFAMHREDRRPGKD